MGSAASKRSAKRGLLLRETAARAIAKQPKRRLLTSNLVMTSDAIEDFKLGSYVGF
jgi:hypothetical protein